MRRPLLCTYAGKFRAIGDLMITRSELISYCDRLLESKGIADYCPNGLQVEGCESIQSIVSGVTASLELIEAAAERGASVLLVHHGILWGREPVPITRSFRRRVKTLLDNDINLIGYHLPLDRHLEVGNGAAVARRLGFNEWTPFGRHKGITVGVQAAYETPTSIESLTSACLTELGSTAPVVFPYGPSDIRKVGIVTGAADKDLPQALEADLDCFITGEVSEYVMHFCKEEGIHFIGAGHHATERWGIQDLCKRIQGELSIPFEYVDVPNPV